MRIIINGALGKMGTLAVETLKKEPMFEIVATLHSEDNLASAIEQTSAQIVVDLTTAESVYANSLIIIEKGAHPVIGTSGLLESQIKTLSALCEAKQLGGIIVPNFSIAAVLMMRFAAEAARWMPEVEIVESHHQNKLDAPSGTALKTAELINQARRHSKKELALKELVPGARGANYADVPIHSLRLPGLLARQEIIFGASGETLTLTHNAQDRFAYMPGLVLACQKVSSLKTLYYGLEHLL